MVETESILAELVGAGAVHPDLEAAVQRAAPGVVVPVTPVVAELQGIPVEAVSVELGSLAAVSA